MPLRPGSSVERYIIEGVIGEGAMAVVYLARHRDLGSLHALKELTRPEPDIRERLIQEGRLQSTLRHPNVVSVTDLITIDEMPALVMEYVQGPTLQQLLHQGPLSLAQVDALAGGILRGVAAAHAHGLVHRDLKPANILVALTNDSLVPKIADFGLAKVLEGGSSALQSTQSGSSMGTPAYMAPEQIQDSSTVDARADIFALGAILYELLTGSRCFEGEKLIQLWRNICAGTYTALSERTPDAPERMIRAIEGALMPELDERIQDVAGLLNTWFEGRDPSAQSTEEISQEIWPQDKRDAIEALASTPTRPESSASASSLGLAHTVAESSPDAPDARIAELDSSEDTRTPSRPLKLMPFGIMAALLIALGVWLSEPSTHPTNNPAHTESSERPAPHTASAESAPSPRALTSFVAITAPAPLASLERAKAALLSGAFLEAGKLLDRLMDAHPEEAVIFALRALNRDLLGEEELAQHDARQAKRLAQGLEGPRRALFSLSDKSWRQGEPPEALLTQWRTLIDANDDPMVLLLYLSAARHLLSTDAFTALLLEQRERRPMMLSLSLLELIHLGELKGAPWTLKRADEALRVHPESSRLRLARAQALVRLGRHVEAEAALKQLLSTQAELTDARATLANLYALSAREAERVEQLILALSDTKRPTDQLRFLERHGLALMNQGRLMEGSKVLDLCLRTGSEAGLYMRAATCGMRALDARWWLGLTDADDAWHQALNGVLDRPELDARFRAEFRLRALWTKAKSELRRDPSKRGSAEAILQRIEALKEGELSADAEARLDEELRFELTLARGDASPLRGLLARARQALESPGARPTCASLDRSARAGARLGDAEAVSAAQAMVLDAECVPHPYLAIQRAIARIELAKAHLGRGERAQAKRLLGDFLAAWPSADRSLPIAEVFKGVQAQL